MESQGRRTAVITVLGEVGVTVATVLMIGLVWHLACILFFPQSNLFPPPVKVIRAFGPLFTTQGFLGDIRVTLARVFTGLLIGTAAGVFLGALTGRSRMANATLGRLISILRPIPHVALVPFFIIWFGIGEPSKFLIVAWAVFIMVWISTHVGVAHIDRKYLWAGRSLGASRWRMLSDVYVQAALPALISGIRTAIAVSFIVVVVAEMTGASEGVGYRLLVSYQVQRTDRMMACIITLAGVGAFVDYGFANMMTWIFPWCRPYEGRI